MPAMVGVAEMPDLSIARPSAADARRGKMPPYVGVANMLQLSMMLRTAAYESHR